MKFTRISKYNSQYLTDNKSDKIYMLKKRQAYIANLFIRLYEKDIINGKIDALTNRKGERNGALDHEIVSTIKDSLDFETTSRFIKQGIRVAYSNVKSAIGVAESEETDVNKYIRPKIRCNNLILDQDCCKIEKSKEIQFDYVAKLYCLGINEVIYIPLNLTKHGKEQLRLGGNLKNTIQFTKNNLLVFFDLSKDKKQGYEPIAIDINMEDNLFSTSNRKMYGTEVKHYINDIIDKEQGSKGYYGAKDRLKQYVDSEVKRFYHEHPELTYLFMERLENVKKDTKKKKKRNKKMRKRLANWNYAYVMERFIYLSHGNRVSYRKVNPRYTSQACSQCGHRHSNNRKGGWFKCLSPDCDHVDHADFNSTDNILKLGHSIVGGATVPPNL